MDSGVYQIENLANGNRYLGSTSNIVSRWRNHINALDRGQHRNQHLQRAWFLYGDFEFTVLEKCDIASLIEQEQYYMDTLRPEYNVRTVANSNRDVQFSMEARAKMSAARKHYFSDPEARAKISAARKGKIASQEARAKMSAAHKGNTYCLGHKLSTEHRARISAAMMGKIISQETRAKISAALKGKTNALGCKRSAEHRAKISAANKRRANANGGSND